MTESSGMRRPVAEPKPGVRRQRDGARFPSVRRIAVKIRTAGDEQLEARGEVAVPVRRGLVVIGMIGLERIETCGAVCGNPLVDGGLSRVRERGEAAGAVHQRDDFLWRRTAARHKRRTSGGQPAVERLARVRDITSSAAAVVSWSVTAMTVTPAFAARSTSFCGEQRPSDAVV